MKSKNNHFPMNEVNQALGIKPRGEEYYLFQNHSQLSIAKSEAILKRLDEIDKSGAVSSIQLGQIKSWLDNFKVELPKEFDVKVLNQIDLPKNISIDNLPTAFDFNEPDWLKKIYSPIIRELKSIKEIDFSDLEKYTDPLHPLAVRLSDGTKFIKAINDLKQVVYAGTVDQETKDILTAILNALGSISPGTVGAVKQFYGSITGSPSTETLITAYTVPIAKSFTLESVYGQAGTDGIWILYVNSTAIWSGRNAWTCPSVNSNIGKKLGAGDLIELKVTNQKNTNHNFTGGFNGSEI
jgi:hypothetical protein